MAFIALAEWASLSFHWRTGSLLRYRDECRRMRCLPSQAGSLFSNQIALNFQYWASHRHLGAMFRLSRRAVAWLADAGEECREAFCEIANASVVHRAGGSTGDLRQLG